MGIKQDYIENIKRMLDELNERDLMQLYTITHHKFLRRKQEKIDKQKTA